MDSIKKILIATMLIVNIPSVTTYTATPKDPPPSYEIVKGIVTMYSSEAGQTDETPNITANGQTTKPGTIACPKSLKFGTRVEIRGRSYTCNDRMAKRYRDKNYFDVWVEDRQTAINHGRQRLEVKVFNTEEVAYADRP